MNDDQTREELPAPDTLEELACQQAGTASHMWKWRVVHEPLVLHSMRLLLHEFEYSDRAELNAQYADLEHRQFELARNKQKNAADQLILMSELARRIRSRDLWFLGIRARTDGRWLGILTLRKKGQHGEIGFGVVRNAAGNGFVVEAVETLMKWARSECSIASFGCEYFSANVAASRAVQKLGMQTAPMSWWRRLYYRLLLGERGAMMRAQISL